LTARKTFRAGSKDDYSDPHIQVWHCVRS